MDFKKERDRWTEFEGSPNKMHAKVPRVMLSHRGVLRLNKLAYEALNSPAAVKLLFDEHEMVIGLKAEDVRRANAFPVKLKDQFHNRIIHARPFCKHFKIRVERTVLFNEIDIDRDGVMTLPLKQTINIGNRWS